MATHDDDSSIHTTPAPSVHHYQSKTDVDSHFRIDDEQEHPEAQQTSSAPPPPFSSHNFPSRYFPAPSSLDPYRALVTECTSDDSALATSGPAPPAFEESES